MAPLTALLISDRRPGHFHLSEGILAAVARRRRLDVRRLEVRRPRWLTPGLIWRMSRMMRPDRLLELAYGIDCDELRGVGLIVSSGGDTLAANIAARSVTGAQNIFYGSLRRYRPEQFSLVLTSYARNATAPNCVMTLKPSASDPEPLIAASEKTAVKPARNGMLIGGDSGTFHYRERDWEQLLAFLKAYHSITQRSWIVSNSPRTPRSFSDQLTSLAREPGGPICEFIDIRNAGTGTLAGLFAACDSILCTADSSSMLSEAVWMRRPTVAVFPANGTLPADEQAYRTYLETKAWARSIALGELTPERFSSAVGSIVPLLTNPLDNLAEILARHVPTLFD